MVKIDTKHKFNSAVIGMMLFDGSLSNNKYFYIRHGGKQLHYVDEKVKFIEKYMKPKTVRTVTDKNGFDYRYAYFCDERFKYLGTKIYKNGKKVLTKNILNRFDEITLAIMYLDVGCLGLRKGKYPDVYCSREIHLNVQSFTKQEVEMFKAYLLKKWNLDFHITLDHGLPRLWCNTKNTIKFLQIVAPVIWYNFPSMYYKLDLKYKNKNITFLPLK